MGDRGRVKNRKHIQPSVTIYSSCDKEKRKKTPSVGGNSALLTLTEKEISIRFSINGQVVHFSAETH